MTKLSSLLPINPAHAKKSRRSIRSVLRLPRSAEVTESTLPATNRTPIPQYPYIVNEMNIDGILGVRRQIDWIT